MNSLASFYRINKQPHIQYMRDYLLNDLKKIIKADRAFNNCNETTKIFEEAIKIIPQLSDNDIEKLFDDFFTTKSNNELLYYVRCFFCDSKIMLQYIKTIRIRNTNKVKYNRYKWICPCCNSINKSFSFIEDN